MKDDLMKKEIMKKEIMKEIYRFPWVHSIEEFKEGAKRIEEKLDSLLERKIYLVGEAAYWGMGDFPNFDNFPTAFYTSEEDARRAYENMGDGKNVTAYIAVASPGEEFEVVEGRHR